jgi:hypothetical protein
MPCWALVFLLLTTAVAQKSVTVPVTLDHNRVVIDVDLPLPDGTTQRVRAWVDNGNPDMYLSRRVATVLGLNVTCGEKECSAPPPHEIMIGSSMAARRKFW